MLCEDKAIALSVTVSKLLAIDRPNNELAVLASFFSAVAANIGVIIQNRNLCGQSVPSPLQQQRLQQAIQQAVKKAMEAMQDNDDSSNQYPEDLDIEDEDEQAQSLEL